MVARARSLAPGQMPAMARPHLESHAVGMVATPASVLDGTCSMAAESLVTAALHTVCQAREAGRLFAALDSARRSRTRSLDMGRPGWRLRMETVEPDSLPRLRQGSGRDRRR